MTGAVEQGPAPNCEPTDLDGWLRMAMVGKEEVCIQEPSDAASWMCCPRNTRDPLIAPGRPVGRVPHCSPKGARTSWRQVDQGHLLKLA
jgi:hypothetical protein